MATIVNTPASGNTDSGSTGLLFGILLIVAMVLLFYFFGLPLIRGGYSSGPQVNVPDHMNVNVQTPQSK
jgi:hypothetical protein